MTPRDIQKLQRIGEMLKNIDDTDGVKLLLCIQCENVSTEHLDAAAFGPHGRFTRRFDTEALHMRRQGGQEVSCSTSNVQYGSEAVLSSQSRMQSLKIDPMT